jgi:hypothetical protein
MPELPHFGFIQLLHEADEWKLSHCLTGERHDLDKEGAWELLHSSNGIFFLRQGDATVWVNDVLTRSLHRIALQGKRYVNDGASSSWMSVVWGPKQQLAIMLKGDGVESPALVTRFNTPHEGPSVWWHLPYIYDACSPSHSASTSGPWLKKGARKWRVILERLAFGGHIKDSANAASRALQEGRANTDDFSHCTQDYSCSSAALLALLLWWHNQGMFPISGSSLSGAQRLLEIIIGMSCTGILLFALHPRGCLSSLWLTDSVEYDDAIPPEVVITLADGVFDCRRLCKAFAVHLPPNPKQRLVDFVLQLGRSLVKREREGEHARRLALLRQLFLWVGLRMDCLPFNKSGLALGVLQNGARKRRRVSTLYSDAVIEATSQAGVSNSSSFLANVQSYETGRGADARVVARPKGASAMLVDWLWRYNEAAHALWAKRFSGRPLVLCCAHDAARLASCDTLFGCCFHPIQKKAHWMVPQVLGLATTLCSQTVQHGACFCVASCSHFCSTVLHTVSCFPCKYATMDSTVLHGA